MRRATSDRRRAFPLFVQGRPAGADDHGLHFVEPLVTEEHWMNNPPGLTASDRQGKRPRSFRTCSMSSQVKRGSLAP